MKFKQHRKETISCLIFYISLIVTMVYLSIPLLKNVVKKIIYGNKLYIKKINKIGRKAFAMKNKEEEHKVV